jgi:hypothetical protein
MGGGAKWMGGGAKWMGGGAKWMSGGAKWMSGGAKRQRDRAFRRCSARRVASTGLMVIPQAILQASRRDFRCKRCAIWGHEACGARLIGRTDMATPRRGR